MYFIFSIKRYYLSRVLLEVSPPLDESPSMLDSDGLHPSKDWSFLLIIFFISLELCIIEEKCYHKMNTING